MFGCTRPMKLLELGYPPVLDISGQYATEGTSSRKQADVEQPTHVDPSAD